MRVLNRGKLVKQEKPRSKYHLAQTYLTQCKFIGHNEYRHKLCPIQQSILLCFIYTFSIFLYSTSSTLEWLLYRDCEKVIATCLLVDCWLQLALVFLKQSVSFQLKIVFFCSILSHSMCSLKERDSFIVSFKWVKWI